MAPVHPQRLEAHDLHAEEIDPAQLRAVESVLEFLASAQGRLARTPHSSSAIELDRRSQVAFISGSRGTGKTSAYLTLRRLTSSQVSADESKLSEVAKGHVAGLRGAVYWLAPLDLEPQPSETSLLAAVIARLGKLAQDQRLTGGDQRIGDLLRDRQEDLGLTLRSLHDEIALGWEGNLDQRRASLNFGAYVDGVRQVEEAKLDLPRKFDRALEALTSSLKEKARTRGPVEPLLVLPVDDVDLNPKLCVNLLNLIRAVAAKRLVFLLIGDASICRHVLRLSTAQRLAECGSPLEAAEHGEIVRELSENLFRKLIPPGQIYDLAQASPEKALAFPAPKEESKKPKEPSLEQLLEAARFETREGKRSLADLLGVHDANPKEAGLFLGRLELLLQRPWRLVVDLWQRLRRLDLESRPEGLAEFLIGEHEDLASELPRNRARSLGIADRLFKVGGRLVLRTTELAVVAWWDGPDLQGAEGRRCRWFARRLSRLVSLRSPEEQGRERSKLTPRYVGLFLLAHDVCALGIGGAELVGPPLSASPFLGDRFAGVNWFSEGAVLSRSSECLRVSWMAPPFVTFRDLEAFARHWHRRVAVLESLSGSVADFRPVLLRAWLDCCWSVDEEAAETELAPEPPSLEALAKKIALLTKGLDAEARRPSEGRGRRLHELAGLALELLAPESGTSPTEAEVFLRTLKEELTDPFFRGGEIEQVGERTRRCRVCKEHIEPEEKRVVAGTGKRPSRAHVECAQAWRRHVWWTPQVEALVRRRRAETLLRFVRSDQALLGHCLISPLGFAESSLAEAKSAVAALLAFSPRDETDDLLENQRGILQQLSSFLDDQAMATEVQKWGIGPSGYWRNLAEALRDAASALDLTFSATDSAVEAERLEAVVEPKRRSLPERAEILLNYGHLSFPHPWSYEREFAPTEVDLLRAGASAEELRRLGFQYSDAI